MSLLLSFTALSRPAWADISTWQFSVPAEYLVSDSTKIEIVGGVARLIAIDQTDDDGGPLGFGGGAHNQTQWDAVNGWLELVAGMAAGEFTSRVMDAGAGAAWESISWVPRRPYLKELPNYKGVESGYWGGNADMTGNVLLTHLNESPCVHGTVVADSSGESNDGILYTGEGASDKSATGKLGVALGFDGVDDCVEVPDDAGLDIADAITVEAWIDPAASGGAIGEISSSNIDTYEFDLTHGRDPDIIQVNNDVYAVAYDRRLDDGDGWLFTIEVSDDGTIANAKRDSLEFDPQRGVYPDILHVSGDVYAIAYSGNGSDGWLRTVQISGNGTIGNTPLDSFEFDPVNCNQPSIVHVSGDVYAIAYSGYGSDGWLVTVQIASDGTIGGSTIDSYEFDPTLGTAPEIMHVSGDVYAIAYSGPGTDGWLVTVQIASDGTIGGSVIDGLEFDPVMGAEPDIAHVSGEVYCIAYTGPDTDGWVCTAQIADDGTIGTSIIDNAEFDATYAGTPHILHVARDVYAIAYCGPDNDGWLLTGRIADDGTIDEALVDIFEFDSNDGTDPCVVHVAGDVYAIAYSGYGSDGFLTTCEILTERGIAKAGAYGIDADMTDAFAWINGRTISASLSSGWNHVALVYDKDAGVNQQKLYVNGSPASSGTLTDAIDSNTSPLLIGKRFSGLVDEVAVFGRALSPAEVEDHYKRGALRPSYQVRSGSGNPPVGPFIGPDGTASTYYSELSNGTTGLPSIDLTNLSAGRYFQHRDYLETGNTSLSPELESISFGPVHYPGDNPTIQNATGEDYASLLSFIETLGAGNEGSVVYQISNDGASWYYWDGSGWVGASGYSQANTAAEVGANCAGFDEDVGRGEFFFKAFMHSDSASQQVELNQVDLGYIAVVISVVVDNSTFSFGTRTLNAWLASDSAVVLNDGTVTEDFLGRISQFNEGIQVWGISGVANGDDVIRAQWSTAGPTGPWNDISAYDSDFAISTNVAASDSVTFWFRIMTPTSTSSYSQYSSTLTVTAQEF